MQKESEFTYPESSTNKVIFDHLKTTLTVNSDINDDHNGHQGETPLVTLPLIFNNEPENLFFKTRVRLAKNSKNRVLEIYFNNLKFYVNEVSLSDFVRFLERFEVGEKVRGLMSFGDYECVRRLFLEGEGCVPFE